MCNEEQLEAHRRDFLRYWGKVLVGALLDTGYTMEQINACKDNAWQNWLWDDCYKWHGAEIDADTEDL